MGSDIALTCPKCSKRLMVPRQEYDYPEATEMRLTCPDCWDGDFDEPSYFDASGKPVEYDPDEIPSHRARPTTTETPR